MIKKQISERIRRLEQKYTRRPVVETGSELSEEAIDFDPVNYGAFNVKGSIFLPDPSSLDGGGSFNQTSYSIYLTELESTNGGGYFNQTSYSVYLSELESTTGGGYFNVQ